MNKRNQIKDLLCTKLQLRDDDDKYNKKKEQNKSVVRRANQTKVAHQQVMVTRQMIGMYVFK